MKKEPRLTANAYRVIASILASQGRELAGADLLLSTGLLSGTLYPLLMRLENAGWLRARWESETASELGRPRRRYYSVTGKGAAHARSYEQELVRLNPAFGIVRES